MFEILINQYGGGCAKLSHRGRTAWTLRTAGKHKLRLAQLRLTNPNLFKSMVLAKADEYFTLVTVELLTTQ